MMTNDLMNVIRQQYADIERLKASNAALVGVCRSALRALRDNLDPGPMDADAIAALVAIIESETQCLNPA